MPLPSTMTPIATIATTSSAATVTFSNIPQTYTDLILVYNGGLSGFDYIYSRYNSDTGSNYSGTAMYGNGSTASAHRYSSGTYNQLIGWGIGQGTALTSVGIIHFMNYANTTTYKSMILRDMNPESGGGTQAAVHLWRSTSAISSIVLTGINSRTITNGSTFTLYGIKAAS
jgi:hypothetical protein